MLCITLTQLSPASLLYYNTHSQPRHKWPVFDTHSCMLLKFTPYIFLTQNILFYTLFPCHIKTYIKQLKCVWEWHNKELQLALWLGSCHIRSPLCHIHSLWAKQLHHCLVVNSNTSGTRLYLTIEMALDPSFLERNYRRSCLTSFRITSQNFKYKFLIWYIFIFYSTLLMMCALLNCLQMYWFLSYIKHLSLLFYFDPSQLASNQPSNQ